MQSRCPQAVTSEDRTRTASERFLADRGRHSYCCWRRSAPAPQRPAVLRASLQPSGHCASLLDFTCPPKGAWNGTDASGLRETWGFFHGPEGRRHEAARTTAMIKVEAVVIRERVETVIDAVEAETGHVGVTVVEAIGHGRQRGITHEYRGRIFESRFLPKAVLTFVVRDDVADEVVEAIVDAARSGNESGDGIVWTTPVDNVRHSRTGRSLEEVEVG